ncbi:MAG: NERD domain-containing protein [Chloroflexi bacterium]|nr:NERD domain-containing protein [Chloroflexota bacterium]
MRVTHCSPFRDAAGSPRSDNRREAAKALGSRWKDYLKAEDAIIENLGDNLDDEYQLICNGNLLEDGPDTDMLLIGPTGMWVVEFVHGKGLFKASGDDWLSYNNNTLEYIAAEPNPILIARANAIYDYLHSKDLPVPWVNPLLILTLRPADIQQFVVLDIRELDSVMSATDVDMVAETLRPFFTESAPAPAQAPAPTTFMGMSTQQWLIILGLALLNICVLGGLAAFVIYINSRP